MKGVDARRDSGRFLLGVCLATLVIVAPILDVFNVTNTQTATNRNQDYNTTETGDQSPPFTNAPNPRYGMDTEWQRPRLVRLGARVFF